MTQIKIFEDVLDHNSFYYKEKTAEQLCNEWLMNNPKVNIKDIKYQKIDKIRSILVIYEEV